MSKEKTKKSLEIPQPEALEAEYIRENRSEPDPEVLARAMDEIIIKLGRYPRTRYFSFGYASSEVKPNMFKAIKEALEPHGWSVTQTVRGGCPDHLLIGAAKDVR